MARKPEDGPDGASDGPGLAAAAMIECLTDDWGFFIRSARRFERFQSPYQAVEVHDTVPFGRLFRLDGHFMTSEKDEFFYHENLVHLAAITHPAPRRALIVGGGDGGSAEELLKHPSMAAVTLVRNRCRGGRHRAPVSGRGPPRRARRPAGDARDRRWLRLRPRSDGELRPHRARPHRSRAARRRRCTPRISTAPARRGWRRAAR